MTLLSLSQAIRAAWDALFVSRHTLFLEAENSRLRAQLVKLEMDLKETRLPIQAPSAGKEDNAKVPQQVGGVQFWDAPLRAKQRAEIFAEELVEVAPQEN